LRRTASSTRRRAVSSPFSIAETSLA